MTKRQLIDEIRVLNVTASPDFLAAFGEAELGEYLRHLQIVGQQRLSGDARRYEKYFEPLPAEPTAADETGCEADRPGQTEPVPAGVAVEAADEPNAETPFANSTEETHGVLF